MRFFTKIERSFLLLNQFNTHWEFVYMIFIVSSMSTFFETNLRLCTPISNAIIFSIGMDSVFLGEILDFSKIR